MELDSCGVLRDPTTNTCPFAQAFAQTLVDASINENGGIGQTGITSNAAVTELCTGQSAFCNRCLQETNSEGNPYCADFKAAMTIPSIWEDCQRCFQPVLPQLEALSISANKINSLRSAGVEDDTLCTSVCISTFTEQTLFDAIASTQSTKPEFCVTDEALVMISSLTEVALEFDKITYAVGAYQAVMTLITLFPASFSLMYGALRGATMCKVTLPWSRLPGYMVGASVVFCMPMFTALLAVVYQLIGDYYCCIAFLLLLSSLIVWLPERKSKVSKRSEPRGSLAVLLTRYYRCRPTEELLRPSPTHKLRKSSPAAATSPSR